MAVRRPLHVVVAGGGPAAAEAALALREHAGDRVRLTLVAPEPRVPVVRAGAARLPEPFRDRHDHGTTIRAVAARAGGSMRAGRVVAVDGDGHRVRLADRRRLAYDALVLAVGARPRPAYEEGALTFFGKAGAVAINRLVAEAGEGCTRALAFVVPPGTTWPLPLYELALQTATALRGQDVGVRLITPERGPLALFGAGSEVAVRSLLDEAGVAFTGSTAVVQEPGGGVLTEGRDGPPLPEDRVVALPVLDGPALPGVPATDDGFVLADRLGAVPGLADVFAAGDATRSPFKHLDAARDQAAVVAAALAARAGAYVPPPPPAPAVRAHLLAGGGRTLVLERDAAR
jgi:sulfide:quinone oxidoreductase